MIINKLRIQEEHPMSGPAGTFPLPFCDLNLNYTENGNGYILKDSTGLGPPPLTKVVTGFSVDGIPIYDSLPGLRQVVLKIALSPVLGQSFGSLRDALYKMISRSVYLKLMNDSDIVCQTTGYIQRIEPALFTNRPEFEITIECKDSVFSAPDDILVPEASYAGGNTPVFDYPDGNAPTGFRFEFTNTVGLQFGFSISNQAFWHGAPDTGLDNTFALTYSFDMNDIVMLNTHPTVKTLQIYDDSAGMLIDVAGYLNPGAVWPKLYPGVNEFSWDLDWVTDWEFLKYIPRYWGI